MIKKLIEIKNEFLLLNFQFLITQNQLSAILLLILLFSSKFLNFYYIYYAILKFPVSILKALMIFKISMFLNK
jgi:hypothetical protein